MTELLAGIHRSNCVITKSERSKLMGMYSRSNGFLMTGIYSGNQSDHVNAASVRLILMGMYSGNHSYHAITDGDGLILMGVYTENHPHHATTLRQESFVLMGVLSRIHSLR